MSSTPEFAITPALGAAALSTAEASLTAPVSVATVLAGATKGTRVHRIVLKATGVTTAGLIRLFLHDGTMYHLFAEIVVEAITPSSTVAAWEKALVEAYNPELIPLVLKTGWSLRATCSKTEAFKVTAHGADL